MKNIPIKRKGRTGLLAAAMLLALSTASQAAISYTVTLNVSTLIGNTNAPFYFDVQMAQGSGNVANSVSLSNFQVIGGSLVGSADASGAYTGSLASILLLDNSAPNTYYAQQFTVGTTGIMFDVSQTTNSEFVSTGTAIPDQFSVFIDDFNSADGYVPTTDPSGGNALLISTISSGETYHDVGTYSSIAPDGGVSVSVVPEPTSVALLLLGGCGLVARRRRV